MAKRNKGRGGKKGEKRDGEGGRDSGRDNRRHGSGSNAFPLGQLGNALSFTNYGGMRQYSYSLQDEARDTERHRSTLWSSTKLRNNKVTFVSAGHFDAKKLMELDPHDMRGSKDTSSLAESLQDPVTQLIGTPEGTQIREAVEVDNLVSGYSEGLGVPPPDVSETAPGVPKNDYGALNTHAIAYESGSATPAGLSLSVEQPPSPTPSDSSQEMILFAGRNQDTNIANKQTARRPTSSRSIFEESYTQDMPDFSLQTGGDCGSIKLGELPSSEAVEIPERPLPAQKPKVIRGNRESDMIADYIANLKEHGDMETLALSGAYATRELGGSDTEDWQESGDEDEPPATDRQTTAREYAVCGWGTPSLHHHDAASAYIDTLGDIDSILAKRSRPTGDQFLVQFKGYSINDVKWIPRASLTAERQLEHIAAFENSEGPEVGTYGSGDSDDMDEDWGDGEDLQKRRITAMTDGKLARLFARQSGLGMASNRLVGFDDTGGTTSDEDLVGDESFIEASISKDKKASRRRGGSSSAARIADAYDGFDIMDFERPSLRSRKGRKAALPFNLSDSELEASISLAWGKDRKKKSEKKKERAELRAQGIFGKYNDTNPDLRAKYDQGMTTMELEYEIRQFLLSDRQQLIFPPMEKHRRKMLHETGALFHLKSKSCGKVQRFTTLYKSASSLTTPSDVERAFSKVKARGLLSRMGIRSGKSARDSNVRSRHGGAGDRSASYRDGEIVGAAAPELGIDNKGRQMLEKMGWSSGTALGALNNKGILQPVATVVKTTKAGLG
ncbi:hypothetical protein FGG08_001751 [Glutinoglossum americanum]|uniref:Protein SQS1 n=1 Tax=Glutinoglossum americanum TaxID=1670608 RepID=A0A9P8IAY4_9PEZI|nr:hypothetical protein FGG08_001751 [Glutinoglossum americanum]